MARMFMLIGSSQVGKTTLIQMLKGYEVKYKKTQSVERIENFIDVPGEYVEIPRYYHALMVTSYDADMIILVQGADEEQSMFPPKFASAFNKKTIGVITKTDLAEDTGEIEHQLKEAGAEEIFKTSLEDESSVDELREFLLNFKSQSNAQR